MRAFLVLLFASLLIAPGIVADDGGTFTPLHGCEDGGDDDGDGIPNNEDADCHDHDDGPDSPGIGLLAAIGAIGAVAFVVRRRSN